MASEPRQTNKHGPHDGKGREKAKSTQLHERAGSERASSREQPDPAAAGGSPTVAAVNGPCSDIFITHLPPHRGLPS